MASTKKQRSFACRQKNRRDSGIYSESGPSEAEVPLKRHDDSLSDNKRNSTFEPYFANGNCIREITQNNTDLGDESSAGKEYIDRDTNLHSDETNFADSENDQTLHETSLLKPYEHECRGQMKKDVMQTCNQDTPNNSVESVVSYSKKYDERENSIYTKSHIYEYINSLRQPSMLSTKSCSGQEKSFLNQADVEVINRCDGLINQLQDSTQKYYKLAYSYRKNRRLFYILAVVNLILIMCVLIFVPLLMFTSRKSDNPTGNGSTNEETGISEATDKQYNICFNCSDLTRDPTFTLETLVEVLQVDGRCCFKSIISVMKSQNWNFENALDESTKGVRSQISELDRRLLQLEIGSAPDTNAIIGNILKTLAPKEKTALYLKSARGTPFGKEYDSFYKLQWSPSDSSAILRGGVTLDDNGMNIIVKSEAYYFLYTKMQFIQKERSPYDQSLPLSYLIYRKRGSISTYVHEAKLNCIFNDKTQEHSSTSEMVLHLNRNDEIFVSVDESDKDFLSTDLGAHMIGLFEI